MDSDSFLKSLGESLFERVNGLRRRERRGSLLATRRVSLSPVAANCGGSQVVIAGSIGLFVTALVVCH